MASAFLHSKGSCQDSSLIQEALFKQFYTGIPHDLESAAKMDGCNHWMTYVRVMLPNARPALITAFLLSFVWHWNDYHLSLLFFQATNEPMSVRLYKFTLRGLTLGGVSFTDYLGIQDMPKLIGVACLLSILPVLVVYIFTQKYYLSIGVYA